jgi:hypothetical protein
MIREVREKAENNAVKQRLYQVYGSPGPSYREGGQMIIHRKPRVHYPGGMALINITPEE